ncbi:hypothetical protein BDQ17DRAFT_1367436 [Cyathus striatus]|nr:hypothetical protein BDQ17DRAFT_1367436 [Cyathus striatus]
MLRSLTALSHHTIRQTPTPPQSPFSSPKSTKRKYSTKSKNPPHPVKPIIDIEHIPAWKNLRPGSRLQLHAKVHSLLRRGKWRDAEDALNPALAKARRAGVHWNTAKATSEVPVHPRIHPKTTYAVIRGSLAALDVDKLSLPNLSGLKVEQELLASSHLPAMGAPPLALIEHPSNWTTDMWMEIITLLLKKGMYLEAMLWLEEGCTGRNEETWNMLVVAVEGELQHPPEVTHRIPYPKRSAVCAALRMVHFRFLNNKDAKRQVLPLSIYDTIEGLASTMLGPRKKETLLWFSNDIKQRKLMARRLLDSLIQSDAPKRAVPFVAYMIGSQTRKQFSNIHIKKIDDLIATLLKIGPDDIDKLPPFPDPPLGYIDQTQEYFTAAQCYALGFEGALQLLYLAHSRQLPIKIQLYERLIEKLLSQHMLYQAAIAVHMVFEAYVLKWKEPKATVTRRQAFFTVVDASVANLQRRTIEEGLVSAESNVVSEGEQQPGCISPFILNQSISAIVKFAHLLDLRMLPAGNIGNLLEGIYLILKYDIAPEEVREYLLKVIKRTVEDPPVFYKKYTPNPESQLVLQRILVEILKDSNVEMKVSQKTPLKVKANERKPAKELAM